MTAKAKGSQTNLSGDAPTVTVITTVLNAVGTIKTCLDSVAGQQGPFAVQHIVVDGGSKDGTRDVLEKHAHRLGALILEPDQGLYEGMNKGLKRAGGEIVGFLNADDRYADTDILAQVVDLFRNPRTATVYGDLDYMKQGRLVRRWRAGGYRRRNFYWGWMPPHPTFYARRCLYQELGGFNTRFGSAADYELILRFLVRHEVPAVYLPRVMVLMEAGGVSNAALVNHWRAHRMDRRAWRHNRLTPYPWTLWLKPLRKLGQFGPLAHLFYHRRQVIS